MDIPKLDKKRVLSGFQGMLILSLYVLPLFLLGMFLLNIDFFSKGVGAGAESSHGPARGFLQIFGGALAIGSAKFYSFRLIQVVIMAASNVKQPLTVTGRLNAGNWGQIIVGYIALMLIVGISTEAFSFLFYLIGGSGVFLAVAVIICEIFYAGFLASFVFVATKTFYNERREAIPLP